MIKTCSDAHISGDAPPTGSTSVIELDARNLRPQFVQEWAELEHRALEPNIYLSPFFVLPALSELTPDAKPILFAVYLQETKTRKLIGVALFTLSSPRRYFPLPHLVAYQSEHSYLSGILIDSISSKQATHALLTHLAKPATKWKAVRFGDCRMSGEQGQLIQEISAARGTHWHELYAYERAILRPHTVDGVAYEACIQRVGGKDMNRRIRRLSDLGQVTSRVLKGAEVTDEVITQFLKLEDREWTRQSKTSLLAAGHERFMREVCNNLRQNSRIFVYELLLNKQVIASAMNFRSGEAGFAFKIGWDQAYAKMSPGIINEIWFMRDSPTQCSDCLYIDSGASEGSFIDKVWPDRVKISTGLISTSRAGNWTMWVIEGIKSVRTSLIKQLKKQEKHK